jgi:hypothetical protein
LDGDSSPKRAIAHGRGRRRSSVSSAASSVSFGALAAA